MISSNATTAQELVVPLFVLSFSSTSSFTFFFLAFPGIFYQLECWAKVNTCVANNEYVSNGFEIGRMAYDVHQGTEKCVSVTVNPRTFPVPDRGNLQIRYVSCSPIGCLANNRINTYSQSSSWSCSSLFTKLVCNRFRFVFPLQMRFHVRRADRQRNDFTIRIYTRESTTRSI